MNQFYIQLLVTIFLRRYVDAQDINQVPKLELFAVEKTAKIFKKILVKPVILAVELPEDKNVIEPILFNIRDKIKGLKLPVFEESRHVNALTIKRKLEEIEELEVLIVEGINDLYEFKGHADTKNLMGCVATLRNAADTASIRLLASEIESEEKDLNKGMTKAMVETPDGKDVLEYERALIKIKEKIEEFNFSLDKFVNHIRYFVVFLRKCL